ncbi:hypothetical protein BDL97_02G074700 [Sphagnum fallax]|nr:hypothetical protein BDL97_02G074700 [Sphagnum fallax]
MMQRSKSLQSRRGWMLNHHVAGADIGRPLFTDKRAPVTFAETATSYTLLTQKKQVLRTEGKQEGEQLDNKHEKAAVGEQRHEEDHDSDLPQHTNNPQARQMQTGNEGVVHASRASSMAHTYNSSQLDHIFNPMPPSEPKRDEVSKGRGKRNYLKEHRVAISEMSTSLHAQKQEQQKTTEEGVREATPRPLSRECPRPREQVRGTNYIAKNMEAIKAVMPPEAALEQDNSSQHQNFGKVPPYIVKRRNRLAECAEARRQEEIARKWPPGLVLMPEAERQAALSSLQKDQSNLLYKLQCFPLVVEIPSLVKSKSTIEQKLREVENAIRRFSQASVYIAASSKAASIDDGEQQTTQNSHRDSRPP